MRIKELAQRAACSTHTIRYYERQGLMTPRRTPANHRSYGAADLAQLQFIRSCRAIGLPLTEVRALIGMTETPSADCTEVSRLLARHSRLLETRIQMLQGLKGEVDSIRKRCARGSAGGCLILRALRSPGA